MSKVDARKLKAIVGSLKDQLSLIGKKDQSKDISSKKEPSSSISSLSTNFQNLAIAFHFVFVTEFLQRGYISPSISSLTSSSSEILSALNDSEYLTETCLISLYKEALQLFSNICNVAGKPLLEENGNSIPKPLLMATCAISGMACEKCAEISHLIASTIKDIDSNKISNKMDAKTGHSHAGREKNNGMNDIFLYLIGGSPNNNDNDDKKLKKSFQEDIEMAYKKAMDRCKEVQDNRILTLLTSLTQQPTCSITTNTSTPKPTHLYKIHDFMLIIARANYLRAANEFSNSNVPQMWKRALDVTLLQRQRQGEQKQKQKEQRKEYDLEYHLIVSDENELYQTLDASLPLINMARIALSKANEKRASELYLRLVESFLSESHYDYRIYSNSFLYGLTSELSVTKTTTTNSTKESLTKPFYTRLPYASFFPLDKSKKEIDVIKEAKQAIQKVNPDLIESDFPLYYDLLSYRIELVAENNKIGSMAHERHQAYLNRKQESTTMLKISSVSSSSTRSSSNSNKGKYLSSSDSKADLFTRTMKTVRNDVLTETIQNHDEDDQVDQAAIQLLHATIKITTATLMKSKYIIKSVSELLEIHISRSMDRIQAYVLSHNNSVKQSSEKKKATNAVISPRLGLAWKQLYDFVAPIFTWECLQNKDTGNNSLQLQDSTTKLGLAASMALLTISWMATKDETSTIHDNQVETYIKVPSSALVTVMDYLTKCKQCLDKYIVEQKKEAKKNDPTTSSQVFDVSIMKTKVALECALSAGSFRRWLSMIGNNNYKDQVEGSTSTNKDDLSYLRNMSTALQKISEDAITIPDGDATHDYYDVQFGRPFLRFLLAWSGLHHRPWSFCTITQARQIISNARTNLESSCSKWGRPISKFEKIILLLGEADAESGILPGGFTSHAKTMYLDALGHLSGNDDMDDLCELIKAICLNGLARIAFIDKSDGDNSQNFTKTTLKTTEKFAKESLETLERLQSFDFSTAPRSINLWTNETSFESSVSFQLCTARRLSAESLLRSGRPNEALQFLQKAVEAFPNDYDAAVSLGAYRLRTLVISDRNCVKDEKKAQTQLLKAAKLDSGRADAFALLGIWYEMKKDLKRAVGCHSKAILIDPSHPVAGRGLLRLKPFAEVQKACHAAVVISSPLNGWAWKALGKYSSINDYDDNYAITCFQQSLRCKDIQNPENETLGFFYNDPCVLKLKNSKNPDETIYDNIPGQECGDVWSLLASCYRRLGKYSASVRAYNFAHQVLGRLSPPTTCALAQVELDLGLYDEAVEKFSDVLRSEDKSSHSIAAYGKASGMLSIAGRDVDEGKFGTAFFHLMDAIKTLLIVETEYSSSLILLGDMYSFGAKLPPDVFSESFSSDNDYNIDDKLSFIAKGAVSYEKALSLLQSNKNDKNGDYTEEEHFLIASAACNLGVNQYKQAVLVASYHGEGSGGRMRATMIDIAQKNDFHDLIKQSITSFTLAIDLNDMFAPAWCGLGCALTGTDPLLAQHCFCRSLELDKSSPDCWANLGLLYIEYGKYFASAEALDALTQVADSPLMWIGRGMLLENGFSFNDIHEPRSEPQSQQTVPNNDMLCKAADAYRASLQTAQHPSALLGLSLTCRRLNLNLKDQESSYIKAAEHMLRVESNAAISMFNQSAGGLNIGAQLLEGIMDLEDGKIRLFEKLENCSSEKITLGKEKIHFVKEKLVDMKNSEIDQSKNVFPYLTQATGLAMSELMDSSLSALESVFDSVSALKLENNETYNSKSNSEDENSVYSAKRSVHGNPDDSEAWIYLSKAFVKESATITGTSNQHLREKKELLKAATTAAMKGRNILHDRLTNATMFNARRIPTNNEDDMPDADIKVISQKLVLPKPMNPSFISEALSLIYWLNEVEKNGEKDDENYSDAINMMAINLQKALMIDPDNTLAREGLMRLKNITS